uniref:Glycylpeptide N-tetradecanoyltransferase n=1 Tax=viral metagenome TaxID=1070528 RepID=A0A6C0HBW3_9ZZZZ
MLIDYYNNIHNIKYIFFIFICIIFLFFLSFFLYIRFKFGFWRIQPVFHIYDLHYYLFPHGIIQHCMPERNKYCNFKDIEVVKFDSLDNYKISKFASFVQSHYLRNKDNVFLPKEENIVPYFTGHNHPCFVSFYNISELLLDCKTNTSIENNKIIGVMTSRPVRIYINNGSKDSFFDAYYVDYLCVDKNHRKAGIAPQIIQTHEYNQRLLNEKIVVSLFKREGELTGIVPLCVYSTYGFEMRTWKRPPRLPGYLGLIEIGPKNMHYLVDFIKIQNTKFDIVVMPEISNLIELIKTGNIYCYIIVHDFEVLCVYFFRKSCAYVRKNVEILSCFASINSKNNNPDIFVEGYKVALWKIYKKHPGFQYAVIEDTSDNNAIIKNIMLRTKPTMVSPTAYFFYNFAYPTFKPSKCLILH